MQPTAQLYFPKVNNGIVYSFFRLVRKVETGCFFDNFARERDAEIPSLVACHFPFGFVNLLLDSVGGG